MDALALLRWLREPSGRKGDDGLPIIVNHAEAWNANSAAIPLRKGFTYYRTVHATDGDEEDDRELYELALSLNVHRRHLTPEQKRDLIAKLLKAQPETSDRTIGKAVKADGKTVAKVREELEQCAEIPHVETRTDSKGRKQQAKRKTDDPKLAALRERAAEHGLRIRKRGPKWVLIDADGKSTGSWYTIDADGKPTGGSETLLDAINWDFDAREGKVASQVYSACGMRTDCNNSEAWLAAHPGKTMEDFERVLPPAPTGCDLDEQSTLQSTDDTDSSAEKRKAQYAEADTELTPVPSMQGSTADGLRKETNEFHQELGRFLNKYEPKLMAWLLAHQSELGDDARGCLHNGLMHAANCLMNLDQMVDGRGHPDLKAA